MRCIVCDTIMKPDFSNDKITYVCPNCGAIEKEPPAQPEACVKCEHDFTEHFSCKGCKVITEKRKVLNVRNDFWRRHHTNKN